jgi:hypothetical protein
MLTGWNAADTQNRSLTIELSEGDVDEEEEEEVEVLDVSYKEIA